MKLALFDLDHTLLNTDSDHSWGEFLVNEGLVDPIRHRAMNDKFYEDYKAGQLDPIAYNEFVFEFLTQHDHDYLTELHQLFMQKVIRPQTIHTAKNCLIPPIIQTNDTLAINK